MFFYNGKPVEQKAEKFEAVAKPVKKAKAKKAVVKEEPKEAEVTEELPPVEYETKDETEDF